MTTCRSVPCFILAAALLGCADTRPPLTSPAQGGYSWTELRSRHFALRTDLDARDANQAISEFEAIYSAFTALAFPTDESRTKRIDVVVFRRPDDYRIFGPKGSDAFFDTKLPNDVEPVPTAVIFGQLTDLTRLTFQHELTHHFVRQSLASAPVWLHEGMAQYYSTLRVEDGKAYLGAPLPTLGFTRGRWAGVQSGAFVRELVPAEAVPSVSRLVGADRETFYAARSSATKDNLREQTAYYGGAWALVHLMMTGPAAYRARFAAFIDGLTRGTPSDLAWGKSFDAVDPDELQRAFHDHLVASVVPMLVKDYTPRPPSPVEGQRAMSEAEVHLLWARLAPWRDAGAALARAHLDAALASDAASPEVHLWRGLFFLRTGQLDEAERELRAALTAANAAEPRYLLALLRLEEARQAPGGVELRAVAERLAGVARTATELDAVARVQARVGEADLGLSFAVRAIKADPTCWRCTDTYAALLFEKGRVDDAALAAERTVALLPEELNEPAVVKRMVAYKAAARAKRMAPPSAAGSP